MWAEQFYAVSIAPHAHHVVLVFFKVADFFFFFFNWKGKSYQAQVLVREMSAWTEGLLITEIRLGVQL